MGADNWTYCPRCKVKSIKETEDEKARIDKLYGKVPAEKYLAELKNFDEEWLRTHICESTLREDYEVSVTLCGEFYVVYKCRCTVCGYGFIHRYNKSIPMNSNREDFKDKENV